MAPKQFSAGFSDVSLVSSVLQSRCKCNRMSLYIGIVYFFNEDLLLI